MKEKTLTDLRRELDDAELTLQMWEMTNIAWTSAEDRVEIGLGCDRARLKCKALRSAYYRALNAVAKAPI